MKERKPFFLWERAGFRFAAESVGPKKKNKTPSGP